MKDRHRKDIDLVSEFKNRIKGEFYFTTANKRPKILLVSDYLKRIDRIVQEIRSDYPTSIGVEGFNRVTDRPFQIYYSRFMSFLIYSLSEQIIRGAYVDEGFFYQNINSALVNCNENLPPNL